jgi:hypothetical protein
MLKISLNQDQVSELFTRSPLLKEVVEIIEAEKGMARIKGGTAKAALQISGVHKADWGIPPKEKITTSDLDGWCTCYSTGDFLWTQNLAYTNPSEKRFERQCNSFESTFMGIDNASAKLGLFLKPGLVEVWVSKEFKWDLSPSGAFPYQEFLNEVSLKKRHEREEARSKKIQFDFQSFFPYLKRSMEYNKFYSYEIKRMVSIIKGFLAYCDQDKNPWDTCQWILRHNRPWEIIPELKDWYLYFPESKKAKFVDYYLRMVMHDNEPWFAHSWEQGVRLSSLEKREARAIAFAERYGLPLPNEIWGIKLSFETEDYALHKGASQEWIDMVQGLNRPLDFSPTPEEQEANYWFPDEGY